jgi:hypothetical protein
MAISFAFLIIKKAFAQFTIGVFFFFGVTTLRKFDKRKYIAPNSPSLSQTLTKMQTPCVGVLKFVWVFQIYFEDITET